MPRQELEIAVSGSSCSQVRSKRVIEAWTVRGIQKRRFLERLTQHIEQPRLMVVEIVCLERNHKWAYSVEKDDPQPHVDVALGFLIVKPPPVIVSMKSTSAFFRYWMLIGSTNNFTPWDSKT